MGSVQNLTFRQTRARAQILALLLVENSGDDYISYQRMGFVFNCAVDSVRQEVESEDEGSKVRVQWETARIFYGEVKSEFERIVEEMRREDASMLMDAGGGGEIAEKKKKSVNGAKSVNNVKSGNGVTDVGNFSKIKLAGG